MHARAIDSSGEPRGERRTVAEAASRWASQPQLVALPERAYFVVWLELIGSPDRLMGRAVDETGSPLAPAVVLDEVATGVYDESPPAAALGPDGVVSVAWGVAGTVRARRLRVVVSAEGATVLPLTPAVELGSGTAPRLAGVNGGFLAAWMRLWIPVHLPDEVAVRAFGNDGSPRGAEHATRAVHPLARNYGEDFLALRLAADTAGRALLLWQEADGALYTRRFAGGLPLEEPHRFEVPIPGGKLLTLGELAARADGHSLLTWTLAERLVFGCPQVCELVPPSLVAEHYAQALAPDGTRSAILHVSSSPQGVYEQSGGAAAGPLDWVVLDVRHDGLARIGARRITLQSCAGSARELCLADRFRLAVDFVHDDFVGAGQRLALTADTGSFWFFSPENVELVAKVVDGTAVNGHHWLFFASLTDVAFELVVTDTVTGVEQRYANPRGTMASRADVAAFPEQAATAASRELATSAAGPAAATLAGGRFTATVDWRLRDGTSATATAVPLSDDTTLFWFFSPQNLEMAVKVLDGTAVNGHHWVFFASLTDVEFDLTVVDHSTGEQRTYHNPAGTMASRADVEALD